MTPEEQAIADAAAATAAAAAKVLADKLAADKAAADKAAAEKAVAEKAAADKLAAEEAARIAASTMTDKEAELLKEVMKNKEKVKTTNAEKAALEEKLKAFEGIDPAKAKEMLDAANKAAADKDAAEKKRLEEAGEFDRLKKMMADEHKKEQAEAQTQIKANKSALDAATKTINDLTVGASFNTSKFIADELVLPAPRARQIYGDHFDIENGNVVAYDKPKGAEGRTKLVNSSGEALGFEESIKKLVDSASDKDQLYKSKLKPGARSTTVSGIPVKETSHATTGEVSGRERIQAALNAGALKKAK